MDHTVEARLALCFDYRPERRPYPHTEHGTNAAGIGREASGVNGGLPARNITIFG